jgi:hypothetical protein
MKPLAAVRGWPAGLCDRRREEMRAGLKRLLGGPFSDRVREVAIKILPEEFARDADRVSRFQREAEVLASLNLKSSCSEFMIVNALNREFARCRLLSCLINK